MEKRSEDRVSQRYLLDCTLRDGGYVNEWEFDVPTARDIIHLLDEARVDFIELGIMGVSSKTRETTRFNSFAEIEPLLVEKVNGCTYCVMINFSEKDHFTIPPRGENTVDCIRIAFFKEEWKETLAFAKQLRDKGYLVFLQAMATPLFSDEELIELVREINKLGLFSFYIVDSFGVLYNQELLRLVELADRYLDPSIALGFHGHNNIQMAFSNAVAFYHFQTERALIADASIYGMGRGAGNVTTELAAQYLNARFATRYDVQLMLQIFDRHLRQIFTQYFWGYTMEYFMTSIKSINSAYAWYFGSKGITSLTELNDALDQIPPEIRYTLVKKAADRALDVVRGG